MYKIELYKLSKKIYQRKRKIVVGIFTHDVILFPDYQIITRQISNQLARGHKTIGNHLNLRSLPIVFNSPPAIIFLLAY